MRMAAPPSRTYSVSGTMYRKRIVYSPHSMHSSFRKAITYDSSVIFVCALADANRSIVADIMHSESVDVVVRSAITIQRRPVLRYQKTMVRCSKDIYVKRSSLSRMRFSRLKNEMIASTVMAKAVTVSIRSIDINNFAHIFLIHIFHIIFHLQFIRLLSALRTFASQ